MILARQLAYAWAFVACGLTVIAPPLHWADHGRAAPQPTSACCGHHACAARIASEEAAEAVLLPPKSEGNVRTCQVAKLRRPPNEFARVLSSCVVCQTLSRLFGCLVTYDASGGQSLAVPQWVATKTVSVRSITARVNSIRGPPQAV